MNENTDGRRAYATSAISPTPRHETLVAALDAAAHEGGDFLTFHGVRDACPMRYRDALDAARQWSAFFHHRGVRPGDRVPILLPTGPAFVGALLGAMLAGAVPVPLASPMTFGSIERYLANLAAIVADCGARHLVTFDRVRVALAGDGRLGASLGEVLTEADLDGTPQGFPRTSVSASDTALLQYTSGTTGRPKGVVVSHRALVANAFAIAHGLALGPADVGVSWLPLFHDMGLIGVLLTAVCHPYPLHVMPPEAFVMRPQRWLRVIAEAGATVSAAPNFAYELCVQRGGDLEGARLDRWRRALNGSEPVLANTVERFSARFARDGFDLGAMTPVYGMAECTLAVTFPRKGRGFRARSVDRAELANGIAVAPGPRDLASDAVSVGVPVAGTTVGIYGPDGALVEEGRVGEVRVMGPSLMDGYFRNENASAEAFSGAWLKTGDLGFMHDGELYLVGRAREVIIKGGRNVYPQDIERVASDVRGVRAGAVAAFARGSDRTGTDDIVVVAETATADADERERIAREVRGEVLAALGVKVDDVRLWPVGAIPRTTSGKIQRRACARRFDEEGARP